MNACIKNLGIKAEDKKLYKLAKARKMKEYDLDQMKCIKDKESKLLI